MHRLQVPCKVAYNKSAWSATERNNFQKRSPCLERKACQTKGCTPKDVSLYTCQTCKETFGMKYFNVDTLRDVKYHERSTLECLTCAAAVKNTMQGLQTALKKSKRFCKCFCPLHKESCPLSACYAGEERCPGSDGFISAAERAFLDELNPRPK